MSVAGAAPRDNVDVHTHKYTLAKGESLFLTEKSL